MPNLPTRLPTLPPRRRVATKMRELRVAKGLTQVDLAVLVGIGPSYLSDLERAPSLMTHAVAERVAEALGCTVADIKG